MEKKQEINYSEIYKTRFKKIPSMISTIWGIVVFVLGFIEVFISTDQFQSYYHGIFKFITGRAPYISAIFAGIIWIAIAVFIRYLICNLLRISISQKIVVVDLLTEIRDKNN